MNKRLLALLLGLILAFGLCACGGASAPAPAPAPAETEEAAEEPAEETQEEPAAVNEADIDGCHVVVTGFNVAQDYNGDPMLVVNYDFTNNTDENQTPIWTVFAKAFQDGVELDIAFSMDDSVFDAGIEQKELRPGVSMTGCQKAYSLTSTTSPVEFFAGDMLSQDEIQLVFEIAQ